MKKIGVMTTGGDCSGLNTVVERIMRGAIQRNWRVYGILNGMDGLGGNVYDAIEVTPNNFPPEVSRLAGSILQNGSPYKKIFETAMQNNALKSFGAKVKKNLKQLGLDALVVIGGNGSLSLTWATRDIYSDIQLVCVPKTIDMDVPLTDKTIGFDTAVQQLTNYCDQLMMTARSHHRWFVVQAMGRECGQLALHAGVACGVNAILIPEIKFNTTDLIAHVKKSKTDYGIIMVSEGIKIRGHSGQPADMISRELNKVGIVNRVAFPEHIQRTGDTTACDRVLATRFADCALHAIENNETFVMTAIQNNECKTVSMLDVVNSGHPMPDPNIPGSTNSAVCVEPDNQLLHLAGEMGIYVGNIK